MSELNEHLPIGLDNRDTLLEKFESVEDLAKSYQELSQKLGSGARVPTENSPKEDWDEFHSKMGVPSELDGYAQPEGHDEDQLLGEIRDVAHKNKVTLKQWEVLAQALVENRENGAMARATQKSEAIEGWKRTAARIYGEDLDKKSALAERALNHFVNQNEDLKAVMEETGMGHHPAVMDFMVQLGEQMADDTTPDSETGMASMGDSAAKLAERGRKLALMRSLRDSRDPEHEEVLKEFMEIQRKLDEAGYDGVTDPRLQSQWIV